MGMSLNQAELSRRPRGMAGIEALIFWARRHAMLLLILGCTLVLLPLALAVQRSAMMAGDAPFYIAMQQAILHHGSLSLPAEILGTLGEASQNPGLVGEGRVIRGTGGAVHPVHFWFYPLISVPFAAVLGALGLPAAYGFIAVNIAFFLGAIWALQRSTALSRFGKAVVLLSFAMTTITWYVAWPHPEVFTACLLLVASLASLERRHGWAALAASVAALQNPSAILMLGGIGLVILADAISARRQAGTLRTLVFQALRLVPGAAVASVPYIYNLLVLGVANPIVANGYVDLGQITLAKLASLLFDPNQGFAIGFPFVVTVFLVVVPWRVVAWFRHGVAPIRAEDALLVAVLAMAIPVLGQINFNAGQYYASRYVSWIGVPAIVWTALQAQRRGAAFMAYLAGLLLYLVNFALFFGQKVHYVLTIGRAGGPVYEDQLIIKPLAALLLAVWPGLYTPWPEVFVERVLGREMPHGVPRPAAFDIVGYGTRAGVYTVVMSTTPDALAVGRALCGPRWTLPAQPPAFTAAGAGYFVTHSGISCGQPATPLP
jgi:hypothetical protein